MSFKYKKRVQKDYFGLMEFVRKFPDEETCENHLIKMKWPDGFCCSKCNGKKYYKLKGIALKRRRLLQCANNQCKKQVSLTKNTIFHASKLPLQKWFCAIFLVSQTKKGISGVLLSKQIHVSESTALLMQYKLRKEMEENMAKYRLGGPGCLVLADEFEVEGRNFLKQTVLALLEINSNKKQGRIRLIPIPDKKMTTLKSTMAPLLAQSTTLGVDCKNGYLKIATRNFNHIEHAGISHRPENFTRKFLDQLDVNIGNFKKWYRGIHHSFALANTGYYCNEFSYRFNRRRIEANIFDRLLGRAVSRSRRLKMRDFYQKKPYQPLAA